MTSTQMDAFIASLSDPELADLLLTAQNSLRLAKIKPDDAADSYTRELEEGCFAMKTEIYRRQLTESRVSDTMKGK